MGGSRHRSWLEYLTALAGLLLFVFITTVGVAAGIRLVQGVWP